MTSQEKNKRNLPNVCSFLSNKIDIQDKQNITCLYPTSNDLKHQPTDEHGYDDMGSGALKWLEIFFEKMLSLFFWLGSTI